MNSTLMLAALVAAIAFGSQSAYAQETATTPDPVAPEAQPTVDAPAPTDAPCSPGSQCPPFGGVVVSDAPAPYVPPPQPVLPASMSQAYHPDLSAPVSYPFKVGMLWDISVPSGMALGLQARLPSVPWFKLGAAATMTLAPGYRFNVLLDPIKFGIAPIANIDVGHQTEFSIPGVNNSPKINFTYCDLQGGIGLGSRDGFRFMLMAGMSYLAGIAHNFQGAVGDSVSGLTIGDPNFTGWVPNAKLGFNFLF